MWVLLPSRSMDIITDSRRALQRNVKRRATWLPDLQAGASGQQPSKRGQSGPVPIVKPSVLSPPDMVWPAQNLVQVMCCLGGALHMTQSAQA